LLGVSVLCKSRNLFIDQTRTINILCHSSRR